MNWREEEYKYITKDLARYENTSQKLISFISGFVGIAFLIGDKISMELVFPFIPIISILVFQYLISNNYAYRVREKYLEQIEENDKGFFSNQISEYYKKLKWWEFIIHPFNVLMIFLIIILIIASCLSYKRTIQFLSGKDFNIFYYSIIVGLQFTIFIGSFIWSIRKLNKINNGTTTKNIVHLADSAKYEDDSN